jgi:hypothetical protein
MILNRVKKNIKRLCVGYAHQNNFSFKNDMIPIGISLYSHKDKTFL